MFQLVSSEGILTESLGFLFLLSRVNVPKLVALSPLEKVLTSLHYQYTMQPRYLSGTITLVLYT